MKEYIGHASNVSLLYFDETQKLQPSVELIVIVSEPQFQIDPTGCLVKLRTTETLRFSLGPNGLNALIAGLQEVRTKLSVLPSVITQKEQP